LKKFVSALALLALLLLVLISGCNGPVIKPESESFSPKFVFTENSALFQKTILKLEIEGEPVQSQEMKTAWIVTDYNEASSGIQMIVLEASQETNGEKEDLCESMPYYAKRSSVRFYSDGRIDYGEGAESVFKFPATPIKQGDTWEFDGIQFLFEEIIPYSNSAGDFNCLEISFSGIVEDSTGIASIEGRMLFDFNQGLMVLNHQEKTLAGNQTITISNELQSIKENFTEEPDLSCVFASENLSIAEKLEFANFMFAENEFLGSIEIAMAAKQELEALTDLNELEREQLLTAMLLLADNHQYLGKTEKELSQRLENAEFILPSLEENTVNVGKLSLAFLDLKKVAESNSPFSEQAAAKLADLNARIKGFIKGTAALSDTGLRTGLKILSVQGPLTLNFDVPEYAAGYSMPVLDLAEGEQFTLFYYANGYVPQALPPITATQETFDGEYSIALKPMQDQNKGILSGLCYSLGETGLEFKDSEITVLEIGSANEPVTAVCDNGFYSIELNPGQYAVNAMSISHEVKAAETTALNILE